ncbi:hypothetical protein FQR65_LT06196 [Abscondita terminalis]|nr:hypothetical protein FQR65_LT06196 [Abscondita terminalis]
MCENLREIINGAMMPQYIGKKVSVTGLVTKVNPNGLTFDIRSVDDVSVKVNLRKPHTNPLEGHVEVHGVAQSGPTIICDELIEFPVEESSEFDAASHNILCQLLQTVPNLWNTSITN